METNHRNEDGQSAASELICELRRVCEFIRAPLHKLSSCVWDAEEVYISLLSNSSISCVNCTDISSAGIHLKLTSNISLLSVSSISCVNCTDICRAGILYSITSDISLNLFPPTIEGFTNR